MRGAILPRRDGEFSLKYDSRLCKKFVNGVRDVRVPDIILPVRSANFGFAVSLSLRKCITSFCTQRTTKSLYSDSFLCTLK